MKRPARQSTGDPLARTVRDMFQGCDAVDAMPPGKKQDEALASVLRRVRMLESVDPPRRIAAIEAALTMLHPAVFAPVQNED